MGITTEELETCIDNGVCNGLLRFMFGIFLIFIISSFGWIAIFEAPPFRHAGIYENDNYRAEISKSINDTRTIALKHLKKLNYPIEFTIESDKQKLRIILTPEKPDLSFPIKAKVYDDIFISSVMVLGSQNNLLLSKVKYPSQFKYTK